jgi:hypothetical protein
LRFGWFSGNVTFWTGRVERVLPIAFLFALVLETEFSLPGE